MNISDCIDSEMQNQNTTNSANIRTLTASTLEEVELIHSVAKLLYKTKSVRKSIDIIDSLANCEYVINHSFPPKIVFNFSNETNEEILERYNGVISKSKHEQIPYSGC